MGFFKGLAKLILFISFSLIMVGVVAGVYGYYYFNNELLPFFQDRYDKLERFDVDPVAAHGLRS